MVPVLISPQELNLYLRNLRNRSWIARCDVVFSLVVPTGTIPDSYPGVLPESVHDFGLFSANKEPSSLKPLCYLTPSSRGGSASRTLVVYSCRDKPEVGKKPGNRGNGACTNGGECCSQWGIVWHQQQRPLRTPAWIMIDSNLFDDPIYHAFRSACK